MHVYVYCVHIIFFFKADPQNGAIGKTVVLNVNVEVVKQLRDLESSFSKMLMEFRKNFPKSKLEQAKYYLSVLLGVKEIESCKTITELLDYCDDTFNTSFLEEIAEITQKMKLITLVKNYNEKKNAYLEHITIKKFHETLTDKVKPELPRNKRKISLKIPDSYATKRSLKDMEHVAGKAFGDYSKSFVSLHVEPGSFYVCWFFPEKYTTELQRLATEKGSFFLEKGIEEVVLAKTIVFQVLNLG